MWSGPQCVLLTEQHWVMLIRDCTAFGRAEEVWLRDHVVVLNQVFPLEIERQTKIGPNLNGRKSELCVCGKNPKEKKNNHNTYPTSTGSSKKRTKRLRDQTESKTDRQKLCMGV